MPASSVDGDTVQERELRSSYTSALAHLHTANCNNAAYWLTHLFERLLDKDGKALIASIYKTDEWNIEARDSLKMSRAYRVLSASNSLGATTSMLNHFGRDQEADWCRGLAAEFRVEAENMHEDELELEKHKRSYVQYSS